MPHVSFSHKLFKDQQTKKKKKKNILVIRSFRASEQTSWFELKGIGP